MKPLIDVRIADGVLDEAAGKAEYQARLSRLLDDEIARFDEWMRRYLGGSVIPLERAIIKTYLYRKIKGDLSDLDSKSLDPADVISPS